MCCYVLFQSIIQNWVEVRATYIQTEILKINFEKCWNDWNDWRSREQVIQNHELFSKSKLHFKNIQNHFALSFTFLLFPFREKLETGATLGWRREKKEEKKQGEDQSGTNDPRLETRRCVEMEKTEISFCARFPPLQIIHALTALCSFLNIELRALLSALSPLRFHAHFLSRKIFNTERKEDNL